MMLIQTVPIKNISTYLIAIKRLLFIFVCVCVCVCVCVYVFVNVPSTHIIRQHFSKPLSGNEINLQIVFHCKAVFLFQCGKFDLGLVTSVCVFLPPFTGDGGVEVWICVHLS